MTLPRITLPPGETLLTFSVDGDLMGSDDGTPGQLTFKVEAPQVIHAEP